MSRRAYALPVVVALISLCVLPAHDLTASSIRQNQILGIDANYVGIMEQMRFHWRYHLKTIDVYQFFQSRGIDTLRLRIFVKDNGTDSLPYAITTAKRAQTLGMQCTITLFLNDNWSDIGKQPSPSLWNIKYDYGNLSLDAKAAVIRNYTKTTTATLLANGIDASLYEIGNEIDFGLCGIYEANTTRQDNISYLQNVTWKQMATLIRAAIEGVQSMDPTSSFILHIAHWWDANFSMAFFKTMSENGVDFHYMGLSFYPSSGIYNLTLAYQGIGDATRSQQLFKQTTTKLNLTIGKPMIISEYAYPSTSIITGYFKGFNRAVDGFPLTKQGQKAWLDDFLTWTHNQSFIVGTFYFSPEFHTRIWAPFSMFTIFGNAKPAIDVFKHYS